MKSLSPSCEFRFDAVDQQDSENNHGEEELRLSRASRAETREAGEARTKVLLGICGRPDVLRAAY